MVYLRLPGSTRSGPKEEILSAPAPPTLQGVDAGGDRGRFLRVHPHHDHREPGFGKSTPRGNPTYLTPTIPSHPTTSRMYHVPGYGCQTNVG